MKIGMMSRWNTPCGVSMHAELVGRAWIRMGHRVKVLAPKEWGKPLTREDESYVTRCYRLNYPINGKETGWFFNKAPFLDNFDVFIVQNLERMPMEDLLLVFPKIRENAKTVLIIHEGSAPKNVNFYKFKFDAIVCFDERYKNKFLQKIFPGEKIHIIPYPCHPLKKGDKEKARKILSLPLNKKIIFNYGLDVFRHLHLLPTLERLSKRYPLVFLTLTEDQDWYNLFEAAKKRYNFIELRRGPISMDLLYTYLHASDALIFHKGPVQSVVVSSTIYTCLGSGCPILAYDTNFIENFNEEIIRYKILYEEYGKDLSRKLEDVFEKRENVRLTLKKAEEFVKKNSSYEVGKRFIELFEFLRYRE